MIMDHSLEFSVRQPITGTTVSTNVVDLGATGTPGGSNTALGRDVGVGNRAELALAVSEAFNGLTSLTIAIEQAATAAFTTVDTVFTSPAYTLAQVNDAKVHKLPASLPPGTNKRYLRLRYTVAGVAPTAGRITAGVVASRSFN